MLAYGGMSPKTLYCDVNLQKERLHRKPLWLLYQEIICKCQKENQFDCHEIINSVCTFLQMEVVSWIGSAFEINQWKKYTILCV